jgi:hypothetical protein
MTTPDALAHQEQHHHETIEFPDKPEGPIAAAILAGGIGCLALGLFTTLAEASSSFSDWLSWDDDVGLCRARPPWP